MLRLLALIGFFTSACLTPRLMFAQSASEAKAERHFYRLDFTVKEVEGGKAVNSRTYSTTAETHQNALIRTGTRLPYGSAQNTSIGYIDLGVSIDCLDPTEVGDRLRLYVKAEVSSVPDPAEKTPSGVPIIRSNKWESGILLTMGQPNTIFSSDDLTSKRKMQLEVVAVPIK